MNYLLFMTLCRLVGNCYSATWYTLSDYEYHISPRNINYQKNFDGALSACNAMNATLAKVNTNEIQQFLTDKINSLPFDPSFSVMFYIGLHRSTDEYNWLDGTMLDVAQWGTGQPSSDYECVVMERNLRYLWEDIQCDTWTSYICSRHV